MSRQATIHRALAAALGCAGIFALAREAQAVQYGELRITSNRTLTDDRYGDIAFDASNITLDCANHQVHISSFTKLNGGVKAAIYADSKTGIRIQNCNIVGGFDYALFLQNNTNLTVSNVTATTSALFALNTGTSATGLKLRASISLFIESDTAGLYSADIRGGFEGIHVDGSLNTRIVDTTVSGCDNVAIVAEGNDGLALSRVNSGNSNFGIELYSSSNMNITNSTFNGNRSYGINSACINCSFDSNVALGNGVCDAYDDPTSSGNTWVSNNFGTICGTVPTSH